jgi:copper(I)-binding protein
MRMRAIDPAQGMVVPSNGKLALAPGGAHVMIMGLSQPLKAGEGFDLTLQFARSKPKQVRIMVKPAAEGGMVH